MQQRDPRKEQRSQGQGKQAQQQGQNQPGQQRNFSQQEQSSQKGNPDRQWQKEEGEFLAEELKCRECGETFETEAELQEHEANCASEEN
jgi:hypothetical protein